MKKSDEDVPQIFPWQISTSMQLPSCEPIAVNLTLRQVVEHDHCYCSSSYRSLCISSVTLGSSFLTTISATDFVCLSLPTADASTLTDPSTQLPPFRIELFADNDEAIQFYTGFESFHLLMLCFNFLGEAADHLQYRGSTVKNNAQPETRGAPRFLSPLNEFFLVLCRLRCALLVQDLAYRFGISHSTVCRIFITWIIFIYFQFKDVNLWPSRQQVNCFLPEIFKKFYPSTRCIIDATEIFIQMPSNPQAQHSPPTKITTR